MKTAYNAHENKTSGPNLDKKCVRLSDTAPFHEMLRKIYFVVKP